MKEVSTHDEKMTQMGIVVWIVLGIGFQSPVFTSSLWFVILFSLIFGMRANLFVVLSKPFFANKNPKKAFAELVQFNQILALIFLTLASVGFLIHLDLIGYILDGMLAVAALLALLGYCVGYMIRFHYYQFINRIKQAISKSSDSSKVKST